MKPGGAPIWRIVGSVLLLWVLVVPPAPPAGYAAPPVAVSGWLDTGLAGVSALCFDAGRPDVVLAVDPSAGTIAYNWQTRQRTLVSARAFTLCGPGGFVFQQPGPVGHAAWRFSAADPAGVALDHAPTDVAQDGSLQVYALDPASPTPGATYGTVIPSGPGALWASSDGGLTWEQRGQQFLGKLESVAVAVADARVLYALTADRTWTAPLSGGPVAYHVYFSPDAGVTWEARASGAGTGNAMSAGPRFQIAPVPGGQVPAGIVQIIVDDTQYGSGHQQHIQVSSDGGRTFRAAGDIRLYTSTDLAYAAGGLLRQIVTGGPVDPVLQLTASTDGGATWQPRRPPPAWPLSFGFAAAAAAPDNLFVYDDHDFWYSHDAGQTWELFPQRSPTTALYSSPYLPLTVLARAVDGHVYALTPPAAGHSLAAPAAPRSAPGATFFPQTGHNLAGVFAPYWAAHGGLAQQGYPLTEPVREVSDLNGQVYSTQYFERAVLEHHAENAPPYDVLLSLLGVSAYQQRYGTNGAPGQQASRDNPRLFPETGHTLGGPFRTYWESHGGLPQQGYPISDEFTEINALDGQPYTVQYFERAVFEQHPENAGTPFAVLLSQLGTLRLHARYAQAVPPCGAALLPALQGAWTSNPDLAAGLGCPGAWGGGQTVFERFEHGALLWVALAHDYPIAGKAIFALLDDGTYLRFDDSYVEGAQAACSPSAPPGRYTPVRGFNKVWCASSPLPLEQRLGWALEPERGAGASAAQQLEHGRLYWTPVTNQVFALLDEGSPGAASGHWRGFSSSIDP